MVGENLTMTAVHGRLRVEQLGTWDEVFRLKAEWRDLTAMQPLAIFLRWDSIQAWIKCFGQGMRPYFLKIVDGATTVGIVPLVAKTGKWRRLPVRQLTFCRNSHLPWGGLVAPCREEEIGAAVWDYLRKQSDWDVLRLDLIPLTGSGVAFQRQAQDTGFPSFAMHSHQFYLQLDGTWESYLAGRSQNFRRNIRRTGQKLEHMGPVTIEVADKPDAVTKAMDIFLEIDAQSWKKVSGEVIASQERLKRYYTQLAVNCAHEGRAWVVIGWAGNNAVSAMLCLRDERYAYGLKTSFIAELQTGTTSPGSFLLASCLQESWRRGLKRFYFLSGNPEWGRWADQQEEFVSRVVFRSSWYGRCLAGVEQFKHRLDHGGQGEHVWRINDD